MINIVAIEGLDGSGKSTFAENVVVILNKIAKNVHIEYVHFPDYTLQSGKEILDFLQHGDINNSRARDKIIRLFIKNRHEWYVNNYERLSQFDNVVIIADRYRHSNDYLNCSKFRDIPNAMAKYTDIELNGYRVPREILNFLLDTPLDLILQRLANKAVEQGIDQYESEANIRRIYSKKDIVTRHCMDKNFHILPGQLLDQKYMESIGNEHYATDPLMSDYTQLYFTYKMAKEINEFLSKQGSVANRGHLYIGRLLKNSTVKNLTKKFMTELKQSVVKC